MKKNRKAEWAKNHESNWVEEEKISSSFPYT